MAYIKNTWKDQEVERPRTYQMTNNSDGSVTLIDDFGLVTELGTPVNADYMNHIEEGIAQVYEDVALKDEVLFKNQLTNCILSAPNGVATYSGNTITVKQGLKVLISNGRNADGTLNNIEYTIPSDIIRSEGVLSNFPMYIWVISENGISIGRVDKTYFVEKLDTSLVDTRQYVYSENKYYDVTSSGATELNLALIGEYTATATEITSLTPYQPVELLKRSDKEEITGWSTPNKKITNITVGASGSTFIAPYNGIAQIRATSNASNGGGVYIACGNFASSSQNSWNNSNVHTTIQIKKGRKILYSYNQCRNVRISISPLEGEVK